jgi:hypothetical protein
MESGRALDEANSVNPYSPLQVVFSALIPQNRHERARVPGFQWTLVSERLSPP